MKAFWRYIFLFQCGWNYERMQSVGYCYTMIPILKKNILRPCIKLRV